MTTVLHLGAHKTASTFLQHSLARNLPYLMRQGVQFVPLMEFRGRIGRNLRPNAEPENQAHARAEIAALRRIEGTRRLILSDENLIGAPREIVDEARLYPTLDERLELVAGAIDDPAPEIFLSVRDPGDFARSIFGEVVRETRDPYPDLDDFRARWIAAQPRWSDLIDRIAARFPQSPLVIWDYTLVEAGAADILRGIAGLPADAPVEMVEGRVRFSLTHGAITEILRQGYERGEALSKDEVSAIRKANPVGPGNRQHRMWSKDEARQMRRAHKRDLARIAKAGGRIRVLDTREAADA